MTLYTLDTALRGSTCTCTSKCTCTRTESSVVQSAIQDDINTRVHQQIQKFLAADLNVAYPFDKLDIDRLVSKIDPQLWAFITPITRSISERKGYNVKTNQPETLAYHVKKVRCLFCLCSLMFCADDRCSVPFSSLVPHVRITKPHCYCKHSVLCIG